MDLRLIIPAANPLKACFGISVVAGTALRVARTRPGLPPDPVGLFSEGGEVINLHIEGSLTIPTTRIKRVELQEY